MITFNKETKTFRLETPDATYGISIVRGILGHACFGEKLGQDDFTYLTRPMEFAFASIRPEREKHSFFDYFPQELPVEGIGDYREAAVAVTDSKNHNAVELYYESHKIYDGAPKLSGLPCVFADKSDCQTLEITTLDKILNLEVILLYTVFSDCNAIVRSVKFVSKAKEPLFIKKALSASFDMDDSNYDMITLHGSWARERHIDRRPIHMGKQGVSSNRGVTSHQEHPFIAILDHNADENSGNVYGVNFIYSGNFVADVTKNQFDSLRIAMGINPENFTWKLNPGCTFETPQAVLTFSNKGLNGMSQAFHHLYRNHLIRSEYKNKMRPILINNWEATYFDFNTQKLLDIAKKAKEDGIEMLVMDDGWFGKRNFDDNSLGDWFVNEEKIQGGLKYLVDEVNKIGLKFGIWFEPEMISPDSLLYKAHPDWAIQIPGREPGRSRDQLILDITRKEVRDYAYNCVAQILKTANIEYVKWDMNRQLSDIGSIDLPSDQTGEFFHRYTLALYEMQERLVTEFPHLLLENCSGGGARFDPGMFYYSPQIWCSDDTDAFERLAIQEGTALVYPLSTMGAHVSVCPNHACGRTTPFKTRGYVALSGTFGYELDITKLSEEEHCQVKNQVALYKKYSDIIRNGEYWRIASFSQNNEYDSWMCISEDKSKALITFVQVFNHPNYKTRMIKLCGLDKNASYEVSYPDEDQTKNPPYVLSGLTLMNAGLPVGRDWGDFQAKLILLTKK